jgi:acylphosphatase
VICVRCRVSGRVQGVWYRAATRDQARTLRLTGRAVNLADGRVEVVACGEPAAVAALQDWLWQGPDLAQVSDVACETLPFAAYDGFTTG